MNKKISQLELVQTLDQDDVLPIVNAGVTKKVKVSQLIESSGETDLSYTPSPTKGTVNSSTGTSADIPLADNTNAGLLTPAEKAKLNGIQPGAEVNVNADWNATSGDAQILNKPTIPSTDGLVPYTGANQNVNLGEYELKAGQVTLDTTPTGTPAEATTRWNDTSGVPQTTLKGGLFSIKNGIDLVARVVNKVTPNATLLKSQYRVVKVSGSQGQRLAVNLAQANNDNNSADTLGIVAEDIATNQEGFIMTVGQLEGINTTGSLQGESWQDGDILYLSPTVAGAITKVKPTGATGHIVVLGYVEYAHANNGKIYVKIMNGWELDELHNVVIDTPLDNQALVYEQSTQLWKNKTLTDLGYLSGSSEVLKTTPSITFVGTSAPSGVENKSYNYQIVGKRVTFDFFADYSVSGTVSAIVIQLPSEIPPPIVPIGFAGASVLLYIGSGNMANTLTGISASPSDIFAGIRRNLANTGFEFVICGQQFSYKTFRMTISYAIL